MSFRLPSSVVLGCVLLFSPVLWALQSGVYTYELSGESVTITACRRTVKGALKIPSAIGGRKVTKLKGPTEGPGAFEGCIGLTAVTIPATVEKIGKDTFKDCSHLEKIVFANLRGTVEIGGKAFADTDAESIVLPKGAVIDDNTFYDSDFETVTFLGAEPPVWLDEALNARRTTDGKLKVDVEKIVIPAHANLAAWKAATPKFLKRRGVIVRSSPRVWIDSSVGGSVTLKLGKKTLSNGALVAKGGKVSVTCTAKSGYAFVGSRIQAEGGTASASAASKRTCTMSSRDVTFSAEYETLAQERADFEAALAAMDTPEGVLAAEGTTQTGAVDVGGTSFLCATGLVGTAFEAAIRGSSLFSTPVKYVFSGLPSGLSVVKDAEGGRHLVGTPKAVVDFASAPVYMTVVASSGRSATRRLNLALAGGGAARPAGPSMAFDLGTTSAKQVVNTEANRINVLAGSAGTVRVACPSGAKVSVAGLPAGLKLKAVSGGYALTGAATKTGTFVLTFTCTKARASTVRRLEYRVWPHPLRGTYRGAVATPKVGCGAAKLVVSSLGRGTLTLAEGTVRTVVKNVAVAVETWGGEADPEEGVFHVAFKLPANKNAALPARTATLGYASTSRCGYRRIWRVEEDCGIVSSGKGATVDFACLPQVSALQLADATWNVGGAQVVAGSAFVCTNAAGGVFRLSCAGNASTRVLTVAGRLPKRASVSCTVPLVCGDVDDGGTPRRVETIAYAPFVAKDADGVRYRITLPLDVSRFGDDGARIERWNGSAFTPVEGAYAGGVR